MGRREREESVVPVNSILPMIYPVYPNRKFPLKIVIMTYVIFHSYTLCIGRCVFQRIYVVEVDDWMIGRLKENETG